MSNPFIDVRIKHTLWIKPACYTFVAGVLSLSGNGTKCQKYARILRQPNLGIKLEWSSQFETRLDVSVARWPGMAALCGE